MRRLTSSYCLRSSAIATSQSSTTVLGCLAGKTKPGHKRNATWLLVRVAPQSAEGTTRLRPILRRLFRISEFLIASMVAACFDQLPSLFQFLSVTEQAGTGEVTVGQVQTHGTAFGDVLGLC